MAAKLGETAKAVSNICEAVRLLKAMREKNSELFKILETTQKRADEVRKLDIPGTLPQELKQRIQYMSDSGLTLRELLESFGWETDKFDKYVQNKILLGSTLLPKVVAKFCKRLATMHNKASDFSKAFNNFTCCLDGVQKFAVSLMDSLKKKGENMEKDANSAENWATGKTVGLTVLGGAGFAALGFFTAGIGWAVAAGVAGTGAGALAAGGVNSSSVANVKEMRELARGILESANKLGAIAKDLKSSSDKAGEMKLDQSAIDQLQTVLNVFRSFQQRDKDIAAQQEKLVDQQETITAQQSMIAELEAQLNSLGD